MFYLLIKRLPDPKIYAAGVAVGVCGKPAAGRRGRHRPVTNTPARQARVRVPQNRIDSESSAVSAFCFPIRAAARSGPVQVVTPNDISRMIFCPR